MQEHLIEYQAANEKCIASVYYSTDGETAKPAVLIVAAFGGKTQRYCDVAKKIAELGYVGIAIDMYGDGKTATEFDDCMALMKPFVEDRALCRQRLLDTFHWAQSLEFVDADRIAIMGYCFGGLCALDLARSGADVKAAISLHGNLSKPNLDCKVKAKIMVLHGFDDPLVLISQVNDFSDEMNSLSADWQLHMYSKTKHSFTDPAAKPEPGRDFAEYNPLSAERAWASASNLLAEVFYC